LVKKVVTDTVSHEVKPDQQGAERDFWRRLAEFFLKRREASVFVVAILLSIYFQAANANYLSLANIQTLAGFAAATVIIAAGEVMLLICGEVDLSVGYIFALSPFIMYTAYQAGIPIPISIILALAVSAGLGFINGSITVWFRVPSFITTLGTYYLFFGLTLTISHGFPVLTPDAGPLNKILGNSIYWESFWALLVIIVMQVVLSWTRWGLYTISTGSNLLGAREVGINVNWVKIGNFMLSGLFAGFSGILETFRITSIDPSAGGPDIMFAAISGAVIGGTALQGGSGTIIGALLGTLVLSILRDGFTLLGVSAFTFNMILGAAIIIAMILNVRIQLLRKVGRE